MTAPDTIDPAAVERLRTWGGDKLLHQMIRLFLENSRTRMDQIRAGAAGDLGEGERGAHSLKSSAANVGAERVRHLAARMEEAALAADAGTFSELLPGLEEAYAEACGALQDIVSESES